ncbi:hypothetical protein ELQ90_04305 [Labedella phragmitis]|uniref:Nuclear transport factor 2 family protein n=1 Tax=Labedella phragmitis TaxID=2498849 RepID=A0A444PZD5_9MICO|nr:hypothetical protein [Labedella phragmitis]RWZ53151.1 hypothetical protein ELQ90_04305 [Labedella phragmitis]
MATEPDDAILAKAVDAYTRYSAALDLALANGDGEFEELKGLATPSFLRGLAADDVFAVNSWRSRGSTSFDSQQLVNESENQVVLQVCRDVSRVRVLDAQGTDVTPKERDDRFAVMVTLQRVDPSAPLLVAGSEPSVDASCEL